MITSLWGGVGGTQEYRELGNQYFLACPFLSWYPWGVKKQVVGASRPLLGDCTGCCRFTKYGLTPGSNHHLIVVLSTEAVEGDDVQRFTSSGVSHLTRQHRQVYASGVCVEYERVIQSSL